MLCSNIEDSKIFVYLLLCFSQYLGGSVVIEALAFLMLICPSSFIFLALFWRKLLQWTVRDIEQLSNASNICKSNKGREDKRENRGVVVPIAKWFLGKEKTKNYA